MTRKPRKKPDHDIVEAGINQKHLPVPPKKEYKLSEDERKFRRNQKRWHKEINQRIVADLTEKIYNIYVKSPLIFGYSYFEHHFRDYTPHFHLKIIENAVRYRHLAVAAPRESAKSTLLNFLPSMHAICLAKARFIVIVQNTYAKAVGSLSTIKTEIKHNPKLADFRLKIIKDAEDDSVIEHPDGFQTRVLCKGALQLGSIRGEKFGAWRPDLIIIDDLEDDELVASPERRLKLKYEFDQALLPAGQAGVCRYIAVGTILHDDSQMARLVAPDQYPEWRKLLYRARYWSTKEKRNKSLWPAKWSVEWLNSLESTDPLRFAKEYQNDPITGLLQRFRKEDFRYWRREENLAVLFNDDSSVRSRYRFTDCLPAISLDLAWEEGKENDFSVIMPGLLTPDNDILVDTYVCKRGLRPEQLEDILFHMEQQYRTLTGHTVVIGFEKAMLEKVMKYNLQQAMRRRNRYLFFKNLRWERDKVKRIVTPLSPRYTCHSVFHLRNMGELESQLLRVPSGTHDDCPDALQGLTQLLEYPKKPSKTVVDTSDRGFNFVRDLAIKRNRVPRTPYIFGKKQNKPFVPAQVTWR